jgi:WD40 repeat protein
VPPQTILEVTKPAYVGEASFSDDESLLAIVGPGVRLYDVDKGVEIPSALESMNGTRFASFSPDNSIVAIAAGEVVLWDVRQDAEAAKIVPSGPAYAPLFTSFSPDGHVLVVLEAHGLLRLYDVEKRTQFAAVRAAKGEVAWFSSDSLIFAWWEGFNCVSVYFLEERDSFRYVPLERVRRCGKPLFVSADRDVLAWISPNGSLELWYLGRSGTRITGRRVLGEIPSPKAVPDWLRILGARRVATLDRHRRSRDSQAFSPDCRLSVMDDGGNQRLLLVDELASIDSELVPPLESLGAWLERVLARRKTDDSRSDRVRFPATLRAPGTYRRCSMDAAGTVGFSPAGRLLATGHDDGTVNLWNAETAEWISSFTADSGCVDFVQFAESGRLLVTTGTSSLRSSLKVWRLTLEAEETRGLFEHKCASCGTKLISPDDYERELAGLAVSVRAGAEVPGWLVGNAEGAPGFRCASCGMEFCMSCMLVAPSHLSGSGKGCPSCGGKMTKL